MIGPEETRRRQGLVTAALGGRHGAIQFKPHDSRAVVDRGGARPRRPARGHRGARRLPQRPAARRLDRVVRRGALAGRVRRLRAGARRRRSTGTPTAAAASTRSCPGTGSTAASRSPTSRSSSRRRGTSPRWRTASLAPCSVCGACDYEVVKNRIYEAKDYVPEPSPPPRPPDPPERTRVRVRYAKLGRLVALSHLETMHALLRAVRRAGLPRRLLAGVPPEAAGLLRPGPAGRGREHLRAPRPRPRRPRRSRRRGRAARPASCPRGCGCSAPSSWTRGRPRSPRPCAPSTTARNLRRNSGTRPPWRSGSPPSRAWSGRSSRARPPPRVGTENAHRRSRRAGKER